MGRWAVRVFAVALLVAVLAPPLRRPPNDSFPLSTYPMFSHPRDEVTPLQLTVAIAPDGTERRLPPRIVSGTTEIIHAASTMRRAIDEGDADGLCAEIVDRLGSETPGTRVEIRTQTYDVVGWFDGDRAPRSTTVHARCEVVR